MMKRHTLWVPTHPYSILKSNPATWLLSLGFPSGNPVNSMQLSQNSREAHSQRAWAGAGAQEVVMAMQTSTRTLSSSGCLLKDEKREVTEGTTHISSHFIHSAPACLRTFYASSNSKVVCRVRAETDHTVWLLSTHFTSGCLLGPVSRSGRIPGRFLEISEVHAWCNYVLRGNLFSYRIPNTFDNFSSSLGYCFSKSKA